MQRQQNNEASNVFIKIGLSPDYNDRLDAIIELHQEGIYSEQDVEEIVASEFKKCLSVRSYRT